MQDFAELDTNHSGALDIVGISCLLERQAGHPVTQAQAKEFLAHVDTDNDGLVTLNEYVAALLKDKAFTVEEQHLL